MKLWEKMQLVSRKRPNCCTPRLWTFVLNVFVFYFTFMVSLITKFQSKSCAVEEQSKKFRQLAVTALERAEVLKKQGSDQLSASVMHFPDVPVDGLSSL